MPFRASRRAQVPAATLPTVRRRGAILLLAGAVAVLSGCGGSSERSDGDSGAAAASGGRPGAVIGADGRPITGAIAAPKPATVSAASPQQALAAYARGFDECARADEAVAPPNTDPIFITSAGESEEAAAFSGASIASQHSNSLGSDVWTYRTAAGAQAALGELRAAAAEVSGVTVGRVERVLYATRGDGVESALRACTEAGKAAEVLVAQPDQVEQLTAAEEKFVRGPVADLSGWCYQNAQPAGNPGSVAEARRTAHKLEQLVARKPDAQTTGGESVRAAVADVVSSLDGYHGCPVSGLADELRQAVP